LVIAGARGWGNETLHAMIAQAASEGWVIPLGFLSEMDLPAVYSGASVFAYPSIYEGFGLPPLEAMATGVPTIVSDVSCLPEVTNGGALLVDAEDIENFATAIAKVLEDEGFRAGLISSGIKVAHGYSWKACVDGTVNVYERYLTDCSPGQRN
jgi:alpha-1,3-rhamnosyl/mannosyltransferase